MCIWDGSPIQPEDEREAEWRDSDGEDVPGQWLPTAAEGPDEWVEPAPGEDPILDLLKRDLNEEEQDGS